MACAIVGLFRELQNTNNNTRHTSFAVFAKTLYDVFGFLALCMQITPSWWMNSNKKVEVYRPSLVYSAKRYSPNFTQLPLGHRTCSFISCLSSPGSTEPGCHFRRTELFKHTSLHCPTRYPLTPKFREWTCGQSALPRSTMSEHNSAQPGIEPAISRL